MRVNNRKDMTGRTNMLRASRELAVMTLLAASLLLGSCTLDQADAYYQEALRLIDQGATTNGILLKIDKAIQYNPARTEYYDLRAKVDFDSARYKDVVADTLRGAAVDPKHAYSFFMRGLAECHLANYTKALADFNQAIMLNPNKPEYFNGRALNNIDLNQYETAVKDAERAIKLDPNKGRWYYARGLALLNLHRAKEAKESLDRCIQLAPDLSYPYAARAAVSKLDNHPELSEKDEKKAKELEEKATTAANKEKYYY